jgi:site-specific DNA-methyltransferase (adenine-specific)
MRRCRILARLYTTESAASFLGVTPSRVRQLILARVLKSEKHGRDHLIRETDLRSFAANRRKPGRPARKHLRSR